MTRPELLSLLPLTLAAGHGYAVQIPSEILLADGDLLPGTGTVAGFDEVVITDTGRWAAVTRADPAFDGVDSAIVVDGAVLIDSRDSLPGFSALSSFESAASMEFDADGALVWIPSDELSFNGRRAIYRDLTPIAVDDQLIELDGVPVGSTWSSFRVARPDGLGGILAVAGVNPPGFVPGFDVLVRFAAQAGGGYAPELLVAPGELLAGAAAPIDGVTASNESFYVDAFGRPLYKASFETGELAIVFGDDIIAVENGPSPLFLFDWGDLFSTPLAANGLGDVAYGGNVETGPFDTQMLVWNGAVVARPGQPIDAIAPFEITDLHFDGFGPSSPNPLRLGPGGALYWPAEWSNPDEGHNSGLFRDYDLVVEEGVTVVEGLRLVDLQPEFGRSILFDVSTSGNRVALWAELEDGRGALVVVPSEDGISTLPSCSVFEPQLTAFGNPLGGASPFGAQVGEGLLLQLEPGFEPLSPEVLSFIAVSTDRLFGEGPCGLDLPGIGEVQLDFSPQSFLGFVSSSGLFPGTEIPALAVAGVPNDPTLIGARLFWQGSIVDAGAPSGNPVRPSNAVETIVNP